MLAYGVPVFGQQPTPARLHRFACNQVSVRSASTRQRVRRYWKKVERRRVRCQLRAASAMAGVQINFLLP